LFTVGEVPLTTASTFGPLHREDRQGALASGPGTSGLSIPMQKPPPPTGACEHPGISTARGPSSFPASCRCSSSSMSGSSPSRGDVSGAASYAPADCGRLGPRPQAAPWRASRCAAGPPRGTSGRAHVVGRRRLAGGQDRLAVGQRAPQILDQLCGGRSHRRRRPRRALTAGVRGPRRADERERAAPAGSGETLPSAETGVSLKMRAKTRTLVGRQVFGELEESNITRLIST
jgi:hypothetical protein